MEIVLTNIYIFAMATTLAILEIQIEGAHGWAKNLPTWRPKDKWFVKLYEKIMNIFFGTKSGFWEHPLITGPA